jgi:hypothetical protein
VCLNVLTFDHANHKSIASRERASRARISTTVGVLAHQNINVKASSALHAKHLATLHHNAFHAVRAPLHSMQRLILSFAISLKTLIPAPLTHESATWYSPCTWTYQLVANAG